MWMRLARGRTRHLAQEPKFKTLLSHLNSVTAILREVAGAVMLANGLALTSAIARLWPN
jgi:hypothetical protein